MAVYEAFYNCRREPFSLSPDPNFLYAAEPHREALAQLRYLVQERKGFAVLTGEVGTGKTMLLRSLIETVGPKVQTGYVFNPPRSIDALYDSIGYELGITLTGVANPAAVLNRHLLSVYEDGGTVVMIFDEAQSLSIELLEEIRLLTNIETSSTKLAQVILAGQPEFDTMIDSTELRALRQRLVFRFSLTPLSLDDTKRYIGARLAAAGAERSPFTAKACAAVHRYSSGVPRLVNVICDNAMLGGYATDITTIDEDQIAAVAAELRLISAPRRVYQPPPAPVLTKVNRARKTSEPAPAPVSTSVDGPRQPYEPAPEPRLTNGNNPLKVREPAAPEPRLTRVNQARQLNEPMPEPRSARVNSTPQVNHRAADADIATMNGRPQPGESAPATTSASINHGERAYEAPPIPGTRSVNNGRRAYEPVPTPATMSLNHASPAYGPVPEAPLVRVTHIVGPGSSNRRLFYSLVLASVTLALVLVVIVIATQGSSESSSALQDMFRSTLRWLGEIAISRIHVESLSVMFRA